MTTIYLLTGDIGGTNSRMHLYDTNSSIHLVEKTYRNEEVLAGLEEPGLFERRVIAPFLQYCWNVAPNLVSLESCEIVACLACAGVVSNNSVTLSNLGNTYIDGNAIEKQFHCTEPYLARIRVCRIINDFVAQGYGCLTLKPDEVRELLPGSHKLVDPAGPKVCVGAGTGLGQCYLTADDNCTYTCYPSEGGHVEYAPRTELDAKMWEYLKVKFNYRHRVSVERVVSGRGLANVYEFLAQEFPDRVDPQVHEQFINAADLQGKVVAENAKEGTLCHQAMDTMISAYGCEVGSAAIKFIPTGGMFVTGGLTPKNIQFIEGMDSPFMLAYLDKGRVSPLLQTIPLFAVMVEDLGVRGAHKNALLACEKYLGSKMESNQQEQAAPQTPAPVIAKSLVIAPNVTWPVVLTCIASFSVGIFLSRSRK